MDESTQNVPIPKALEIAIKHQQAGNLQQAEEIYRQILKVEPANGEAFHLLGLLDLQRNNLPGAVANIQQAIAINGLISTYHCHLGLALTKIARHQEAVVACKKAIRLNSHNFQAYNNLGIAYHADKQNKDAIRSYEKAVSIDPNYAEGYYNLSIVLGEEERYEEAIVGYRKAISIKPNYPDAFNNMGFALHQNDQLDEAAESYQQAIFLKPNYAEAHNNLGAVYLAQEKLDEAIESYRQALLMNRHYAEALNNLGFALHAQGDYKEAIDHLKRAIALKPDYSEAFINLGTAQKDADLPDEAISSFHHAAALNPDQAKPLNLIGTVYQQQGKFDLARETFEKAITIDPEFSGVYRNLVNCGTFGEREKELLPKIEELLARTDLEDEDREELHLALGKINNDLGNFEKAFPHFAAANAIIHKRYEFDHDEHREMIDTLISEWSAEFLDQRADYGSASELPLLVCGTMRSGTTLVEQIISSHPAVFGAGELGCLEKLERTKVKTQPLERLSRQKVSSLAESYLDHLRTFSTDSSRITDKMPGNFLRLGLFHLLFPKARIIHCRRNPVDTCLSIFFIKFAGKHPYAYDLEDLVFYYKEYERLMDHWRSVLPASRFLDVDYEEVVTNQEKMSREIIEFCGHPWDDSCLSFHKNARPIKTASLWQVRQPIYTSSTARWKKYEKFLGPLEQLH